MELILSLADERARKQKRVIQQALIQSSFSQTLLLNKLGNKDARIQGQSLGMLIKRQEPLLLKMVFVLKYVVRLRERFVQSRTLGYWKHYVGRMADRIKRFIRNLRNKVAENRIVEFSKV